MKSKDFIKLCKDNEINDVQITINTTYETVVKTINEEIDKKEVVDITTYMIKATYNDNTVSFRAEYLGEDLISVIKEIAIYTENVVKEDLIKPVKIEADDSFVKESIADLEHYLLEVNELRKSKYKKCKFVTQEIAYGVTKKQIINSEGLDISSSNSNYTYVIEAASNDGGESVTDYTIVIKKDKNELNILKNAEDILKINEMHLTEKTIKNGKYKLLLYPSVTSRLVNYFTSIISGQSINKNTSYLKDKLNEKIFSDKVTIIENPTDVNCTSYRPFDDEGTKTMKKTLVENGVLKTYLYDNKNAKEANTTSTGNSYNGNISCRNVYLREGSSSLDDLIKEMDNGIIVVDVLISDSALSPSTGVYPGQIFSGFLVENGKIKHAIKNAIFTTNLNELFSNIIDIGNELEYSSSSIGAPALLVDNIDITGDNNES